MLRRFIVLGCLLLCASFLYAQVGVWQRQASGTTSWLHHVKFVSATTGWAVGDTGLILKSTNSGTSWFKQSSGLLLDLHAVDFADSLTGWAVAGCLGCSDGAIIKTTNGGVSWSPKNNGVNVLDIQFVTPLVGWAVGGSGLILKSTDAGETWNQQVVTDLISDLTSVSFTDTSTGYVGGIFPGSLNKTIDGGASWSPLTGIDPGEDLDALRFINDTTGWLGGFGFTDSSSFGFVRKTTDGGTTWATQLTEPAGPVLGISFADTSEGWIAGSAGIIARTSNAGSTWLPESSGTNFQLDDICALAGKGVWAVGVDGAITRCDLGGLPSGGTAIAVKLGWNMLSLPIVMNDTRKAILFPTATSKAFYYQGTYYPADTLKNGVGYWLKFTSDQSVTHTGSPIDSIAIPLSPGWNMIGGISTNVPVRQIVQNPPGSVLSVFSYDGIYNRDTMISPGKGYWFKASRSCTITLYASLPSYIPQRMLTNIMSFRNDELPPAAPGVQPAMDDGSTISLPIEYSLAQNYPNPFNPSTTIRFDLPEPSTVRLTIFNTLGQEVTTLVDGIIDAGFRSLDWDTRNQTGKTISSGVYLYRIQATSLKTGKEYHQIHKMILMK